MTPLRSPVASVRLSGEKARLRTVSTCPRNLWARGFIQPGREEPLQHVEMLPLPGGGAVLLKPREHRGQEREGPPSLVEPLG